MRISSAERVSLASSLVSEYQREPLDDAGRVAFRALPSWYFFIFPFFSEIPRRVHVTVALLLLLLLKSDEQN